MLEIQQKNKNKKIKNKQNLFFQIKRQKQVR